MLSSVISILQMMVIIMVFIFVAMKSDTERIFKIISQLLSKKKKEKKQKPNNKMNIVTFESICWVGFDF